MKSAPRGLLLVEGGPGAGKSVLACARISWLILHAGLKPGSIWLVNAARSQICELRERITEFLNDGRAAHEVNLVTLGRDAWTVHARHREEAGLPASCEGDLCPLLNRIEGDESMTERFRTIDHLLVDDAQDVTGVRANIVMAMLGRLGERCGVTVFADDSQAIEGISNDLNVRSGGGGRFTLSLTIKRRLGDIFKTCRLTGSHRAVSPGLERLSSQLEDIVLETGGGREDKLKRVHRCLDSGKSGRATQIGGRIGKLPEDSLVLHRRRCDVLRTSSILTKEGIAHRVCASGLPSCLEPWIAATLSEHTEAVLAEDVFKERWRTEVSETVLESCSGGEAWDRLVRLAGGSNGGVDMMRLRARLAVKHPPAEMCRSFLGCGGAIVSTVHAARGLEAEEVHLWLHDPHDSDLDRDAEARVALAGAARARRNLRVEKYADHRTDALERSGRAHRRLKAAQPDFVRMQFEVGLEGDIVAEGLAEIPDLHRQQFMDPRDAGIKTMDGGTEYIKAIWDGDRYRLTPGFGRYARVVPKDGLNCLSAGFLDDLTEIAKQGSLQSGGPEGRIPGVIHYLYTMGVRTVVFPPGAPECRRLQEPWRSSGIVFAPLILGYPGCFIHQPQDAHSGENSGNPIL